MEVVHTFHVGAAAEAMATQARSATAKRMARGRKENGGDTRRMLCGVCFCAPASRTARARLAARTRLRTAAGPLLNVRGKTGGTVSAPRMIDSSVFCLLLGLYDRYSQPLTYHGSSMSSRDSDEYDRSTAPSCRGYDCYFIPSLPFSRRRRGFRDWVWETPASTSPPPRISATWTGPSRARAARPRKLRPCRGSVAAPPSPQAPSPFLPLSLSFSSPPLPSSSSICLHNLPAMEDHSNAPLHVQRDLRDETREAERESASS